MGYERPYYEDINYRPFLFYVVFGVDDLQLNVSRKQHRVYEFPEGLDCMLYDKATEGGYMNSLIGGALGKTLNMKYPELYQTVLKTDKWAVIRGEVQNDTSLNYMRNTIGFVQALAEKEAVGILDLQTFTLYTPQEWNKNIFELEFNPWSHVVILTSEMEDGSVWLHTRGLRKFGRPDVSMEGVPACDTENAAQVINQMIHYSVLGVFYSRPVKLHTHNRLTYILKPEFVDDIDNPDFNNSYYRLLWVDCETEPEC